MRNPSKNTLKTLFRVNNQSPTPGWAMRRADYFLFNEVGARAYTMSKGKICNRQPKGHKRYLTPHCKTIYQNSKLIMYLSLEFIEPTFESSFSSILRETKLDQFKALVAALSMTLDENSNVAVLQIEAIGFSPNDYYNIEYRNLAKLKLVTDNGHIVRGVVNSNGSHWQLNVSDTWLNFFSLAAANTYIPTGLEKERKNPDYFIDKTSTLAEAVYSNITLKQEVKQTYTSKFPIDFERTAYMKVEEPTYFYISLEHDTRQMRTTLATIIKDLKTLKDGL